MSVDILGTNCEAWFSVAVVAVAVDVDGVLSVELWLVILTLEMEAG